MLTGRVPRLRRGIEERCWGAVSKKGLGAWPRSGAEIAWLWRGAKKWYWGAVPRPKGRLGSLPTLCLIGWGGFMWSSHCASVPVWPQHPSSAPLHPSVNQEPLIDHLKAKRCGEGMLIVEITSVQWEQKRYLIFLHYAIVNYVPGFQLIAGCWSMCLWWMDRKSSSCCASWRARSWR